MKYVKYNVPAEVKKFLAGKPTKVSAGSLLASVGSWYLDRMKEARRKG